MGVHVFWKNLALIHTIIGAHGGPRLLDGNRGVFRRSTAGTSFSDSKTLKKQFLRRFDKVLNFQETTYEINLFTQRKTLALHISIHAFMGRMQHLDRYCTDLDLSIGKHYTTPPTLDDSVDSHPDDFRCGTLRARIS